MRVRLATPADASGIQALLRQPQGAEWKIATTYEPDLAAGLLCLGQATTVVVEDEHGVAACGVRAVRDVWWQGAPSRLGYLALLRCAPQVSPWHRVRLLGGCLRLLRAQRQPDELSWDLTAIMAGNATAMRLFTRGLRDLPTYRPIAEFVVRVISPTRYARKPGPDVRPAQAADLPQITALLAPLAGEVLLSRPMVTDPAGWWVAMNAGVMVATAFFSDVRHLRQVIVHGFPPSIEWLQWPISVVRRLAGYTPLPRLGTEVAQVTIDHVRGSPSGRQRLIAALAHHARQSGATHVAIGGAAGSSRERADVFRAHWFAVEDHAPELNAWPKGVFNQAVASL